MKFITALLLLLAANNVLAQTDTKNKDGRTDEVTFTVVQQPAEFPGGIKGWSKYLQDSLNTELGELYITIPKGQKVARATVIVSFVIDKDGNVADVSSQSTIPENVHPALIKEAIRAIKNGPRWIPAMQNGRLVKYRHKQSITWQVTEE